MPVIQYISNIKLNHKYTRNQYKPGYFIKMQHIHDKVICTVRKHSNQPISRSHKKLLSINMLYLDFFINFE